MNKLHKQLFSLFMSMLLIFSIMLPGVHAVDLANDSPMENASESILQEHPHESDEAVEPTNLNEPAKEVEVDNTSEFKQEIPIKVRVEGYNKTILPLTEINVAPYDITHAVGNNAIGNWYLENDDTLAIHAIVKALENGGYNVSNTSQFDFGQGNFITTIDGLAMNSINPPLDGWMYFVNNEFAPVGVGQFELKPNDEITLYFTTNYGEVSYAWFDQTHIDVKTNEEFEMQLQSNGSVENAVILLNDKPLLVDGKEVTTNSEGKATVHFTEPGEYQLSAERLDGTFSSITRPFSKVIVSQGSEPIPDPDPEQEVSEPEENPGDKPSSDANNESIDILLNNIFRFYNENRYNKDYFQYGIPDLSWTEIVALNAAGVNLESGQYELPSWIENDPNLDKNDRDTLHIRYIFALLALGKDPSNAWESKRNLFAELAAQQNEDTGAIGAVNKHMWAMFALDTGEKLGYNVGNWNAATKTKAFDYLLTQEKAGGGFAFSGETADPDMTGMALLALSNYQNESAAVQAIERVKSVLKQQQLDSAGWGSWGTENSNSIATVISGLTAIGENPMSAAWSKGDKTPLDALAVFQLENGAFTFTLGKYESTNMMATEQSLIALQDIKTGKSAWQQFKRADNPPMEPEQPTNPEPEKPIEDIIVVGDVDDFELQANPEDDAKESITLQLEKPELPKISAERAGVKLEIPMNTTVTSTDWDSKIQVPTVEVTTNNDRKKISDSLQAKNLKEVSAHIKVGGDRTIRFDRHVTLRFDGLGSKEAGFIATNGQFSLIPKEKNDTQDVYAYTDGEDLVIKTKHFTEFLVFETTEVDDDSATPAPPSTTPNSQTVRLSIEQRTMGMGDILSSTQIQIQIGETAYSLLKRIASQNGISIVATGAGPTLYVKSINGLAEFDGGPKSGWMYSVNGEFPQYSAGIYELEDGDYVRWQYTKDLGTDLGNKWDPTEQDDKNESIIVVPSDNNFTLPTKPNDNVSLPVTMEFNSYILPSVKAYRAGVKLDIPTGTTVTSAWDQKIQAPTTVTTSSADIAKINNALPGKKLKGVQAHIKVGGNETIRFDRHVSLTFEGYGDKAAGFIDNKGNFTLIDKKDSQFTNADVFAYQAGRDLIIKTKHFTEFLVFDVVEETTDTMKEDVDTAIKGITEKILRDGVQSEWEAIGLYKAGVKIPASYTEKFTEHLNDQILTKSGNGRMKITDVERLLMAAAVLGIDPENVDGKGFNLLEKIYNSEARTTGEDSLTFQGNNGVIFALIALDSKNYKVPATAKWTREKLVAELLKTQKSDGSWSLESRTDASASVDITAMALIALAPYDKDSEVKKAIAKTVSFLAAKQGPTGGFNEAFAGGITSEAASQVIIALTANGINPRSEQFTKNGIDLMQHLLSFKAADGGFKHVAGDRTSNNMATEQALQALVAYDLFVNKKGSLYSFDEVPVKPVPNPEPTPKPEPTLPEFKDISTHWAKDYIEQAVELGLVKGYEDGTFKPNQSLTRAQAVSILVRALDLKTDKNNPFTDTQKYAKETQAEMAAAYHHGLVKGIDGKFMPTEKVTRAQMALMFYRAYEIQNGHKYVASHYAPFTDMNSYGKEAKDAVDMLYELEMAAGEKGKFMPGNSTTRAHAVKMLIEFLNTK